MQIRRLRIAAALPLILLACSLLAPEAVETSPQTSPPAASETASATATQTSPPTATETPAPSPSATWTAAPPVPADSFAVRTHPDGGLYSGDRVSFEVIAPETAVLEEKQVSVTAAGQELGTAEFGTFGIGDRRQATLRWVWDTAGLEPGDYPVTFAIVPDGEVFTRTVTLLPESLLQYPEPDAAWAVAESECCLVYYVTGTAADRDLDALLDIADLEADLTIDQLGGAFEEPITVVFLPRVLGHGGFAGGEIYISYLDRNYAGNSPGQVLHHEMVHILDGRIGGELRPSLFVEGLAVYLSGGHFKKEPIVPRAAAVVDLGLYIPLQDLADNFYFEQHEISYLQGAALVQFMADTWGWDAFDAFYRDIRPHTSNLQSAAINQALQVHFGLSFAELEEAFLDYLHAQPEDPRAQADISVSVDFFDTVRRYQQALDPSAYFLTAWLIGIDSMLEEGITADYVRHPSGLDNLALEAMLVAADLDLRYGSYPEAAVTLAAVNRVLDACVRDCLAALAEDPLGGDYLAIAAATQEAGYSPQSIFLDGDGAIVLAWKGSNEMVELDWDRNSEGWVLVE